MLDQSSPDSVQLRGLLTQCRILVLAMLLGISSFAVFVVLLVTGVIPSATGPSSVFGMSGNAVGAAAVAATFVASILGIVIERAMDKSAKVQWASSRDKDSGRLAVARVLLTQTIVRAALVEGFALLGIISVMVSKEWAGMPAFAVAAAVLIRLSATESRFESLLHRVTETNPFSGLGGPRS